MKVLFVTHEMDLNGATKSMLNLIDCFKENHQIYVLVSENYGPLYDKLLEQKVTIIVQPYYRWSIKRNKKYVSELIKWFLWKRYTNCKTAKKIAEFAKNEGIDIIHSNSSVINIGALISKYSGIKHIWHFREFGDLDFNMHHFSPRIVYKGFMNKYCDAFIFISKAVYNHYVYIAPEKKHLIYNGVDRSNYQKKDYSDSGSVYFLISGRIEKAKGQDIAVKACQTLLEKSVTNFRLYIAGNGSIAIPDYLKDYIYVLGQVRDMPTLRKKIDVELVCSRAEAFGRSTVEAMLGGIPVIGCNSGGTPELVKDEITGFLFEYGNYIELSEKMLQFINDKKLVQKMGVAAQEEAKDLYFIDKCASNVYALYCSLMHK